MSERSGEIGDFTDADDLESLVWKSSNLDKNTAHGPLGTVRRLLETLNINSSMLEVNGTEVIIHLPSEPDKAAAIRADVEGLGLTKQVMFLSVEQGTKVREVHDDARRRAERLLF